MVHMNRFAKQKLRHRCREQTYGHQGGGKPRGVRGGGVMNWAIRIDRHTLMCIKLMSNKNLLYKKKKKSNSGISTSRDSISVPWKINEHPEWFLNRCVPWTHVKKCTVYLPMMLSP